MTQSPLNTQAPQDVVIQSGFLNYFNWQNANQKSAWIYLNKQDGTDQQGNRAYQSVFCQVFGNAARMLASYYEQMQQAKNNGGRLQVLVQIHTGMVTSFTPQNQQGAPARPVTHIKGFKAYILNPQDRMITDFSEDSRWDLQGGQQGGYAPQGNQAPQQGGQQGGYAPQGNQAPQQGGQQGGYAPQQGGQQGGYAPQGNQAPQQGGQTPKQNGIEEPDFDFDDDIPF